MLIISIGTPFLWLGFLLFILLLLSLDLGIVLRRNHTPTVKESLLWTGVWIVSALLFNLVVWHWFGKEPAIEFFTGYIVEKSLSVDNLFIFLLIFTYFSVPIALQHGVLLWGILGALIMRALFIWIGAVLINEFSWIIYPFGIILLWTGSKLFIRPAKHNPEKTWFMRIFKAFIRTTPDYEGSAFFVKKQGTIVATPLFLVLLAIESTDLVFAIDSIPAVFAITKDPFIVYSSNTSAMLGLRSLYFAMAGLLLSLRYLRYGLSVILIFVGIKMLISRIVHIPTVISLGIIIGVLTIAIVASWLKAKKK